MVKVKAAVLIFLLWIEGVKLSPFVLKYLHKLSRQVGQPACVPDGTCIISNGTIDPRIVTSGQSVNCPPGQQSCMGISDVSCGQRYVSTTKEEDGPSIYGAYPWHAYLVNETGYAGGGVLVDPFHVITAAHKVILNKDTPQNVLVYMGVHDPKTLNTSQVRHATNIFINENFNPESLVNDVAILRLNASVALGYQVNVGTACLPSADTSFISQRCKVSGWGETSFEGNDAPTTVQHQVTVPIVDYATCRESLARPDVLGENVDFYFPKEGEICAGGEENKDACTQDGGSPLVCQDVRTRKFYVAGLVSWGKGCGMENVYGVYADVAKQRSWIDSNMIR